MIRSYSQSTDLISLSDVSHKKKTESVVTAVTHRYAKCTAKSTLLHGEQVY